MAMIETLKDFNAGREEQLNVRVGINSGNVIIGDIGAKLHRRDYTVIGDHVNVAARLESALRSALKACQRLESEPSLEGKVKFRSGDLLLVANDRLNATNDEAGAGALCAALEPVLARLFAGAEYAIERDGDARLRLNLRVRAQTDADTATLLANLAA